jgi:DNA-binding transcriptional regulator YiaG
MGPRNVRLCRVTGPVIPPPKKGLECRRNPKETGLPRKRIPMPRKRLRATRKRAALPEWSEKIANFRNALKLSQDELGKRLGASAMALSRWERGVQRVPANIYIQLGRLAGDPLCWYFWGCAGLRAVDVMRVLPAARQRLQRDGLDQIRVVHAGGGKRAQPALTSLLFHSSLFTPELRTRRATRLSIWSRCRRSPYWRLPLPGAPIRSPRFACE